MAANAQRQVEAYSSREMENRFRKLETLRAQLEIKRSSFIHHWRLLGDYILPRRPRFQITDVDRGDRRNRLIIDSTATYCMGVLKSGMMSGYTSPARPWFRLSTPDPGLAEFGPVKDWLYAVTQRMLYVLGRSNFYQILPILYGDFGCFGTGGMGIFEDFEKVLWCHPFPIGSYCIANNSRLKVNILFREFQMSVRQLVEEYGRKNASGSVDWSNFSTRVKNLYDTGMYETMIDVAHVIQPNEDWNPKSPFSHHKRFMSLTYEWGLAGGAPENFIGIQPQTFLREKGFDYFPGVFPRWSVTGEDSYATDCPGMTSLGDIMALQTMHKRKAQAIEKMVNPAMVGPTSLRTTKSSILPGDITYVDEREGLKGFRPAHDVKFSIAEVLEDIEKHQERIKSNCYTDIFLMLLQSDDHDQTATEIVERKEEKLAALGPVLEQLNYDVLDDTIGIVFRMMLRQGLVPPAPPDLHGMPLTVQYISIMAAAQKLLGVASIDRYVAFVGNVAKINPAISYKLDVFEAAEAYGDATGVPPGIVRPTDKAQAMQAQDQQAQQAQAKLQAIESASKSAQTLSQTDTQNPNALTDLMQQGNAGNLMPAQ